MNLLIPSVPGILSKEKKLDSIRLSLFFCVNSNPIKSIQLEPFFMRRLFFMLLILNHYVAKPQDIEQNAIELIDKAESSLSTDPLASIDLLQEAKSIALLEDEPKTAARALKGIGTAYFYLGSYDSTLHFWTSSMQKLEPFNGPELADSYNNLGIIFQRIGEIDSSHRYHHKSFLLRRELKDTMGVGHSYFNIAALYRAQGNYKSALENYLSALRTYELLNQTNKIGETYNSIGLVYLDIKQYDEALDYLLKALEIKEKTASKHSIAKTMNNIAGIYYRREEFDTAEHYYIKAEEIFILYNDWRNVAGISSNLGNIYKKKEDHPKAKEAYLRSVESFETFNDPEGSALVCNNLGAIFLKEGNYPQSEIYYIKALENSKKANALPYQIIAVHGLSDLYAAQGKYEQAWKYESERVALNDTVFNTSLAEQVVELKEKYEAEKKAKEIQELKVDSLEKDKKSQQQKNWLWGISIFSFFAFSILILIINRIKLKRKLSEKEKERYRLNTELQQKELDAKNRELTVYAGNILQKNQFLQQLTDELSDLQSKDEKEIEFRKLDSLIRNAVAADDDWNKFKLHFEDVHPQFFQRLKSQFSELTTNDLKNSAYIKMKLSTKEVAVLMNISPKSAKMNRYRLKKKLKLAAEDSLQDFLEKF